MPVRLTLFANQDTKDGEFYESTLADLDSASRSGDDKTESETDEDKPNFHTKKPSSSCSPLLHKPAHPPPPEDVDLGAGWSIQGVRTERNDSGSEPEGDTDGNDDNYNEPDDQIHLESHARDAGRERGTGQPPFQAAEDRPFSTSEERSERDIKPKMGTLADDMQYDTSLVSFQTLTHFVSQGYLLTAPAVCRYSSICT